MRNHPKVPKSAHDHRNSTRWRLSVGQSVDRSVYSPLLVIGYNMAHTVDDASSSVVCTIAPKTTPSRGITDSTMGAITTVPPSSLPWNHTFMSLCKLTIILSFLSYSSCPHTCMLASHSAILSSCNRRNCLSIADCGRASGGGGAKRKAHVAGACFF